MSEAGRSAGKEGERQRRAKFGAESLRLIRRQGVGLLEHSRPG